MERLVRIQRIFREIFDDDELHIVPETGQGNLGDWDSVAQVKIILAVEEEFGIHFRTEEVSAIKSVSDLLSMVEGHAGQ